MNRKLVIFEFTNEEIGNNNQADKAWIITPVCKGIPVPLFEE